MTKKKKKITRHIPNPHSLIFTLYIGNMPLEKKDCDEVRKKLWRSKEL